MYKALFELSRRSRGVRVAPVLAEASGRPERTPTAEELFWAFETAQARPAAVRRQPAGDSRHRSRAAIDCRWTPPTSGRHHLRVYELLSRRAPGSTTRLAAGRASNMPTYTDLMTRPTPTASLTAIWQRAELCHRQNAPGPQPVIPVVGDFAGPRRYVKSDATSRLTTRRSPRSICRTSNGTCSNDGGRGGASTPMWPSCPYTDKSLFIRAVLNRPAFTLVSLLAPIADLIKAFSDGRIRNTRTSFGVLH